MDEAMIDVRATNGPAPPPRGHAHTQTDEQRDVRTDIWAQRTEGWRRRQTEVRVQAVSIDLSISASLSMSVCVCVWSVVAPPLPPSVSLCVSLLVCLSVLFVAVSNTR